MPIGTAMVCERGAMRFAGFPGQRAVDLDFSCMHGMKALR